MIYGGFTFSNSWKSRCWYCSKRKSLKCPARVMLDKDHVITSCNLEHNHYWFWNNNRGEVPSTKKKHPTVINKNIMLHVWMLNSYELWQATTSISHMLAGWPLGWVISFTQITSCFFDIISFSMLTFVADHIWGEAWRFVCYYVYNSLDPCDHVLLFLVIINYTDVQIYWLKTLKKHSFSINFIAR